MLSLHMDLSSCGPSSRHHGSRPAPVPAYHEGPKNELARVKLPETLDGIIQLSLRVNLPRSSALSVIPVSPSALSVAPEAPAPVPAPMSQAPALISAPVSQAAVPALAGLGPATAPAPDVVAHIPVLFLLSAWPLFLQVRLGAPEWTSQSSYFCVSPCYQSSLNFTRLWSLSVLGLRNKSSLQIEVCVCVSPLQTYPVCDEFRFNVFKA